MTQLTLFESPSKRPAVGPACGLPVRATDPDPSRRAALRHERRAATNRDKVLEVLRKHPGCSTFTLAQYLDLGPETKTETRRRMNDLERLGLAEKRYTGIGAIEAINGVAWWPR